MISFEKEVTNDVLSRFPVVPAAPAGSQATPSKAKAAPFNHTAHQATDAAAADGSAAAEAPAAATTAAIQREPPCWSWPGTGEGRE